MLQIPGKDPNFPQNRRPISLLSTTSELFEKVILKLVQSRSKERGLLNASRFGSHARHSTTLQCMRLTDHVTLNFNNNMSTAAVSLDIEKAFYTIWHLGLLYKLSTLQFQSNQAYWLFPFSEKIQNFGRTWNVYAKGFTSRGAARFSPIPPHCTVCTYMIRPKHLVSI
jgi:hypothetical protein